MPLAIYKGGIRFTNKAYTNFLKEGNITAVQSELGGQCDDGWHEP